MQVMVWLSLLAELSLIELDSIGNLAEFCRTLLERAGNRPGMSGFALTWLAGARMAMMRFNGIPLIEMRLAPDSLYVRSTKLRALAAYWYYGAPPPYSQLSKALRFLRDLKSRQVNRNLVRRLNEISLVAYDVQHLYAVNPEQSPNLELTA